MSALRYVLPLLGASALLARAGEVPPPVTLLSDLAPEVRAAVEPGAGGPAEILERVLAAAPVYRFDGGVITVDTDRRWFATSPADDPGAPLLELRRWPGDSVLAFYELEGSAPAEGGPNLPGARLEREESPPGSWRWRGSLATRLGERPLLWIERSVPGTGRRLGSLLLPGDAGLGSAAVPDLLREMLAVVARVEVNVAAWEVVEGILAGTSIAVPALDGPPGDGDERKDTWHVMEGNGFTLSLPPGFRARRLDQGVAPPSPIPQGVLWLRGRFTDRSGASVIVGDANRAGYVAVSGGADRAWLDGGTPPLGAPGAARLAADDFSLACDDTGALAARAERWGQKGFEGQWLVFRLFFAGAGVEIGLPVLSGRQSEALFWIPATWRGPNEPPAPPPVDPAERFGISFDQFTKLEKKRRPWSEGLLSVPGLRIELPSGWIPITSLRSEDGFPVTLMTAGGTPLGKLERLRADAPELAHLEEGGWTSERKGGARARGNTFRRKDGARLYRSADGGAVVLVPAPGKGAGTDWRRMIDGVALVRPSKRAGARGDP